jgi:hypothetical protein
LASPAFRLDEQTCCPLCRAAGLWLQVLGVKPEAQALRLAPAHELDAPAGTISGGITHQVYPQFGDTWLELKQCCQVAAVNLPHLCGRWWGRMGPPMARSSNKYRSGSAGVHPEFRPWLAIGQQQEHIAAEILDSQTLGVGNPTRPGAAILPTKIGRGLAQLAGHGQLVSKAVAHLLRQWRDNRQRCSGA